MSSHSEDFHKLRLLLKLKQHEVPPPGYFNRFSRDVMARIKAGETGDKIGLEPAWFQRVLGVFELKPVFAGAFGMAVCALLISGVVSSESSAPAVATANPSGPESGNYVSQLSSPTEGAVRVSYPINSGDSNAVASSPSLFNQFQPQVLTQPASERIWVPGGN